MIFIPSYYDFVRVRNYLKSQNASFCLLGEWDHFLPCTEVAVSLLSGFLSSDGSLILTLVFSYTKNADISRAREWFFAGSRKIMLYTERAYFYRRYKVFFFSSIYISLISDYVLWYEFNSDQCWLMVFQIRGIKNLIFYSLPERKEFYPEVRAS